METALREISNPILLGNRTLYGIACMHTADMWIFREEKIEKQIIEKLYVHSVVIGCELWSEHVHCACA